MSDAARDAAIARDAPADAAFCPAPNLVDPTTAREITIANETAALGSFDPSIFYPAGGMGGIMAYSAVPAQDAIRTHIAASTDGGATWTFAGEANTPEATSIASSDTTECPTGTCTGNLISEVSSIIYDADEPDAAKKWKLFAHRYLVGPNVALHYRIGTIALQTAPQPNGPWTAPQKLIGWTSPAAYTSTGVTTNVNALSGPAADCLILTEPGAIWLPGSIDLAVGCIYLAGGSPAIRIELLRSTDHAASWTSVSTLLRGEDAACLSSVASLNGADLFAENGVEYVSATSSDGSGGYTGCLVFPIDDIAAGRVARDAMGRAKPTRTITAAQFNGACSFAEGTGYAMDIGFLQTAKPFRMFAPAIATP